MNTPEQNDDGLFLDYLSASTQADTHYMRMKAIEQLVNDTCLTMADVDSIIVDLNGQAAFQTIITKAQEKFRERLIDGISTL